MKKSLIIGAVLVLLVFAYFLYNYVQDSFDSGGTLLDRRTAAEGKIYDVLEFHDDYNVVDELCYFNAQEKNYYFVTSFTATVTNPDGIVEDSSNTAVVISSIINNFNTGSLYYVSNLENDDILYTGYANAKTSGVTCESAEEYLEHLENQELE